jgi:hypothetical protein
VGVAVHELHSEGVPAIKAAVERGAKVFVDSGAFSEITFVAVRLDDGTEVPVKTKEAAKKLIKGDKINKKVAKRCGEGEMVFGLRDYEPITDEEMTKRLGTYVRIADVAGSAAYLVAPDKIGDQATTLDRQERFGHLVRAAARRGANIIVPVQKGAVAMADFYRTECEVLGVPESQLVAGIPMKKDATSTADFAEFMAAVRPARVHLLGMGPKNPRFDEVVRVAREASPDSELMCDSVLISSLVGKKNGPKVNGKPGPRILTKVQDEVADELRAAAFGPGLPNGLDWESARGDLRSWMGKDKARKLRGDEVGLRAAWADWVAGKGTTTYRKAEAIRRVFGVAAEAVEAA